MADTKQKSPDTLTVQEIITGTKLDPETQEKLKKEYANKLSHTTSITSADLEELNAKFATLSSTQAQLKVAVQDFFSQAAVVVDALDNAQPAGKQPKKKQPTGGAAVSSAVPANKESAGVASLKLEIERLLNIPGVANDPTAKKLIAEYQKKLSEPSISPDTIEKMRASLNSICTLIEKFDIQKAQDIQEKIRLYTESREIKSPEANTLFFTILTSHLYRLGFRLHFGTGNQVRVTADKPELATDAEGLTNCFKGKPDVIKWMKSGLVMNTSQWSTYMMSYPAEATATVDSYVSTLGKHLTKSAPDVDFLASAEAGGFDIPGKQQGTYIRRGENIFRIATSSQQLTQKFNEMGYKTPLQRVGGRANNFAELALNVAKFSFAAATVWKGAKAVWKTIFGDESAMKAAWGDFAKTAALTGAVYYGSSALRDGINDFIDAKDNPNFEQNLQALSEGSKSGLYQGYLDLRGKTARGFGSLAEMAALPFSSNIPVHQFNTMFGILCTGNDQTMGDTFLEKPIGQLADALNNAYHTDPDGQFGGSQVGGVREFFLDMGAPGEAFYNKFFIHPTHRGHAMTFLTALANYKRDPSQPGLTDSVDRREPISALFARPTEKPVETPLDLNPEVDALKKSISRLGGSAVEIAIKGGTVVGNTLNFALDGVHYVVDNANDFLANFDAKDWPKLTASMKAIAAGLGVTGAIWGLSMIPGTGLVIGTLKWLGIGGVAVIGGKYILDTVSGATKNPEDIPWLPDAIKELIKKSREAGKEMTQILEEIKKSPIFKALPQDMQKKILTVLGNLIPSDSNSGGTGQPTGPSNNPGGAPTETPEQYKKKIVDVATKFKDKTDVIEVQFDGQDYLIKKDLSIAVLANYATYGAGKDLTRSEFVFKPTPPTDADLLELYNTLH